MLDGEGSARNMKPSPLSRKRIQYIRDVVDGDLLCGVLLFEDAITPDAGPMVTVFAWFDYCCSRSGSNYYC